MARQIRHAKCPICKKQYFFDCPHNDFSLIKHAEELEAKLARFEAGVTSWDGHVYTPEGRLIFHTFWEALNQQEVRDERP